MKKIYYILLIMGMFINLTPVLANEKTEESSIITTISNEDIEKYLEEYEESYNMKAGRTTGDYTTELVRLGSTTTGLSAYKEAFSQPSGGTKFSSANSGFYWADSSQTNGSYSVSLTIGGTIASVSLAYQPGNITSGGVYVGITSSQVGKYVKLYVARKYSVTRYAVYKVNKYSGDKTFSYYEHVSVPCARAFTIRTV